MGLQWGEGSGLWVCGVGCHGNPRGRARQRAVIVVGVGVQWGTVGRSHSGR